MKQAIKVLVIGRHAEMLERVTNLLIGHGYDAIGTQTNEEAMAAFKSNTAQAVIIGGGVDEASRILFHATFLQLNPLIKIIDAHPQTVLSDLQKAFE